MIDATRNVTLRRRVSGVGMDDLIIDAPQAPQALDLHEPAGAPVQAIDHLLDVPPHPDLAAVVVVPVHDEAGHLPHLIEALAGQRAVEAAGGRHGYEVILLFSDCRDGSPEVAAAAARRFPDFVLHRVDVGPDGAALNVGMARRLLMDAAVRRLRKVGRERRGVILTTDADTCVAPDWLAANLGEIEAGADAVGGQVLVQPADLARLEPGLRRRYLLHHAYQRLISHLEGLIDPDPEDPLPRHHQHASASLAVAAQTYLEAGGMPALASGEDEAFWRALRRSGARFRHSVRVRTLTSGRLDGRLVAGLAPTIKSWSV
ncbi:MAG TPA: glycosyltransferase, partial [Geminicoccaceae bacterium]